MNTEKEKEKAIRRFNTNLKRLAKRPEKGKEYLCIGGHYNGKHLFLTTDKTLTFRVNNTKGYYVCTTYRGNDLNWFPMQ